MENNVHYINVPQENIYYDERTQTYVLLEDAENCVKVPTKQENKVLKIWNYEKTAAFINIVTDHQDDFKKIQKKAVWNKIAGVMTETFKIEINAQQCDTKWKGLLDMYKKVKTHNDKSGNSRKDWPHFEAMDNLLAKKPEINPVVTCSNSKGLVFQSKANMSHPVDEINDSETSDSSFSATSSHSNNLTKKRKASDGVEKRHKEKMARQDRFLDLFETLVNKIQSEKEEE
ncbi:hypothetical protein ABEB36_004707 [Hypothenemus hampei]|uniref:Myb/SANT-like DNA-binding domain-containing protein n=1 Tax=Hypothenemus hampei TaxID=57062 RepID=A0ABD1F463_HYPHA